MTTDALTLLDPSTPDTWPQGILATGDLREQRAAGVSPDLPWHVLSEHIRAEANPAHALAAVRRWRGVVERHVRESAETEVSVCAHCVMSGPDGYVWGVESWPCPDLTETADEARVYLGGATS